MADGRVEYEVRATTNQLDSDLDQANQKVEKGSGKLAEIGKGAAVAIGGAFVAAGGAAVTFGSQFETSMAKASTLFGGVEVDTDALSDKMLRLSDSTGVAADQLGESLYNALSAGVPASDDMSEALEFLEKSAQLAKAGFTDVDTASAATIKTMNAYKMDIEETDRVQKILMQTQNQGIVTVGELGSVLSNVTPTAAAMGVSFEQVGAGIANMTAQGTPAAQATTQLNSLFAELGKSGTLASKNLAAAAASTEYAGMSFQDMMDAGVPLNEVLDLMGGYAEDNGVGMLDMFSSIEAGKGALANSGQNAEAFTNALNAMGTETDVVGEAFEKVTSTTAEKFNLIMNQLKNSAIDLFVQMQPLITEALPVLQNLFEQLVPPLMELVIGLMPLLVSLFDELIPPLLEIAQALMPVLIRTFETLIPPLLQIVSMLLPPLLDLIVNLIPLIDLLTGALGPILELFIGLLEPIIQLMAQALTPLIALVTKVIQVALVPFQTALRLMAEVFRSVLQGISMAANDQINRWIYIFQNLINFVRNVFTGNWRAAWQNVANIFKSIGEGMAASFKLPINTIIDAINGFLRGLNNIKIPDWVPGVGGRGFSMPTIPRLKVGMDYVPSDDFPALLHQGEAVLTADEAEIYRALGGNLKGIERLFKSPDVGVSGSGAGGLLASLSQNDEAMKLLEMGVTVPVYLDGKMITKVVSKHLGNDARTTIRGKGGNV